MSKQKKREIEGERKERIEIECQERKGDVYLC